MREHLLQKIEESGIDQYKEEILSMMRLALRIGRERNDYLPVGRSKFGGKPDLPADFEYPTYGDGKPQTFLAQYNLEDFASYPIANEFPKKGMLYFFHLEEKEKSQWGDQWLLSYQSKMEDWRVIYWNGDPAILRPYDVGEEAHTYLQAEIWFEEMYMIRQSLPDEYYAKLTSEGRDALAEWESHYGEIEHQLLGFPAPVQGTWYFIDEDKVDDLALLLQLDTDTDLGMEWGDCGTLYFLIDPEDLRRHDFTNTFYEYQML